MLVRTLFCKANPAGEGISASWHLTAGLGNTSPLPGSGVFPAKWPGVWSIHSLRESLSSLSLLFYTLPASLFTFPLSAGKQSHQRAPPSQYKLTSSIAWALLPPLPQPSPLSPAYLQAGFRGLLPSLASDVTAHAIPLILAPHPNTPMLASLLPVVFIINVEDPQGLMKLRVVGLPPRLVLYQGPPC